MNDEEFLKMFPPADEPLSEFDQAINKLEDAAKGARDCLQSIIKLNIPRQIRRLEEALEEIKKV